MTKNDDEVLHTFSTRLKELVAQVGGQTSFAKLAGVGQQTVSGWTRGVSTPDVLKLARICRATSATPNWVLDWEADELTPDERRFLSLYRVADGELREITEHMLVIALRNHEKQ